MKVLPRSTHLVVMRLFMTCSIAACLVGATHAASGVEVDSVRILAPPGASCPAAADVARELSSLLPQLSISAGQDVQPASSVATLSFSDADAYRVDLGSESRTFVDGNHRCADRARTAAVFIAMSLSPPELAPEVTPDFTRDLAPSPPPLSLKPVEQASPIDTSMLAPHLDPLLRASIGVYAASLVGTTLGVALVADGVRQPQSPSACLSSVPFTYVGTRSVPHARPVCGDGNTTQSNLIQAGLVTAIASTAVGVVVGIPLTIVGARRSAKRRAALVPIASGTQVGLATVGTW
jgi:hypothetical protein